MSSDAAAAQLPMGKRDLDKVIRSGLAGGVAGCVAKTVVAPLDRVKILFQASNPEFRKYASTWSGAFRAGAQIYIESGMRGLFQGHSATLLRIFPYAAIKFMTYEHVHQILMPTTQQETNVRRFAAGAISGTISVFFTYPLDLIRVRMAFITKASDKSARPSFMQAIQQIYNEGMRISSTRNAPSGSFLRFPLLKFYRGFSVTMVGMVPYAGMSFLSWGFLRSKFLPPSKTGHKPATPVADLVIGAVSGALAQTASYPFEVIRRRMQVGGITRPNEWLRWNETIRMIWQAQGWRGFYVGLSIGYLKMVPMTALRMPAGDSKLRSVIQRHYKYELCTAIPVKSSPRCCLFTHLRVRMDTVHGKKEKKTRRRLRLSCVECTKRRQKCDRNHPCSLCISRNVPHLCRWENVPVARPTPVRPPHFAGSAIADSESTIKELQERIKVLENALAQNNRTSIDVKSPSCLASWRINSTTIADNKTVVLEACQPALSAPINEKCAKKIAIEYPLDDTVYSVTSFHAQLSLAHHGEFIGRGSLICALHSLSTKKIRRFLYAHSTDATYLEDQIAAGSLLGPRALEFNELFSHIPPELHAQQLVKSFFRDINWQFGIPEQWFMRTYQQMWTVLRSRTERQGGSLLNPNWVSLFFSILALAPCDNAAMNSTAEAELKDTYFRCGMTARCIAESVFLEEPSSSIMVSAADGTVLSCLAAPLLCSYLAERGHASEAWKLVGKAICTATAIGMHQDPGWPYWQVMSEEEKLLRRRAWWGLFVWDRLYSYVLGRPYILRKDFSNVEYPIDDALGPQHMISVGQIALIKLADIVGEAIDKTFVIDYPDCPVFFDLDEKFQRWEESLPPEYKQVKFDNLDFSQAESLLVARMAYLLQTWYLLSRVKLHIACTTGQGRVAKPQSLAVESRERCFAAAVQLIQLQCNVITAEIESNKVSAGNSWYFEGCFSLLEASVTIMTIMTHRPFVEREQEVDDLLNRSSSVFKRIASYERGKRGTIARMSVEVLGVLRDQTLAPE
ncbi:hypothetical protein APHAL10511_000160 [Amanita phalloides]|nr:hypothetical protein APHAL10511_000160 [Amanita phalloides]